LPRAFLLFLVEVKILAPFLCAALLPFDRADCTNRSNRFSLDFDTPNAFAVSSAVANVESSTIVIFVLSSYDTRLHSKTPGRIHFHDTTITSSQDSCRAAFDAATS
jgi:hypothetical protein